jgi:hypothetical protein
MGQDQASAMVAPTSIVFVKAHCHDTNTACAAEDLVFVL